MKTLVAYFSAERGTTKTAAETICASIDGDLFEISPVEPYTAADINWRNPLSRCNREKIGKKDVALKNSVPSFEQYGRVFVGFPIWYYCAPNIINSFCKAYDWEGKELVLFATSGGSDVGKTAEKLSPYIKGAKLLDCRLLNGMSEEEIKSWAQSV